MRLVSVAAVLLFVASASSVAADAKPQLRVGPHFRVICHFDDAAVADAALETVEAVWPLASDLYGLDAAPLETPLDVHLFRNATDYLAADREVSGGKFAQNLAFSSWETRSAYVALQPDLTEEALAVVGLTAQTRHSLAHEASHLVSFRASPSFRRHPQWASEGAAVWLEQETLTARGWSRGIDEDPFSSSDAMRARRLLDGGHLPSASAILTDATKDMDLYDRYAVQSLLFRRLVSRNDGAKFREAFRAALAEPEGPDHGRRFLDRVLAPYAEEGRQGLDLDFEQSVRSRTPAWDELFRALGTAGTAWPQVAFRDVNAMAWRTERAGDAAYEIRGELEILPGTGSVQQMNLLLGREPKDGYVSVAFVAGHGVDVFRFHKMEGRWEKLASAPAKSVQTWRRLPFRVSVDGGRIAIRLDGAEIVTLELKDRPLSGPWGLGVQQGCAGVWRNVRIERSAAK